MTAAVVIRTVNEDDAYHVWELAEDERAMSEVDDLGGLNVIVDKGGEQHTLVRVASGYWRVMYVSDDVEAEFDLNG